MIKIFLKLSKYSSILFFITVFYLLVPFKCFTQEKLSIIGLNKVDHKIEPSLKYKFQHSNDLSARYQIFIKNISQQPINVENIKKIYINGRSPDEWHNCKIFSWYRFPYQHSNFPEEIPANSLMIWEFNGRNNKWLQSSNIHFRSNAIDTTIKDDNQLIYISNIVFTGPEKLLHPDLVTIHIFNDSKQDYRVSDIIFWQPSQNASWHFLYPVDSVTEFKTIPNDKRIMSGEKSILQINSKKFMLGYIAIQVRLSNSSGGVKEIWAYVKIKKESFDISSGWSNNLIDGKPAFLNEEFLKILKYLHVNTAHYNGQPGYSDNDQLFSRYPIKYFGSIVPWENFDKDSLLHRIHAIEILGEPQYGGGNPVDPQQVNMELIKFAPSRIPTTLTHSEERIWRFYSGLSDYPHYDAYRVSSPSADKWRNYDRWNGKKISWGAPLETIGTMTRSLKYLNRPAPVAYWSQGPHSGWQVYGGRKRTSPTASELRVQAYHALSTGITSLYWFNLSHTALIKYPDLIEPMKRIGREILLLDSFYIHGTQWIYEQQFETNKPIWDLSTFVAPQGVILFALDLDYSINSGLKTFTFTSKKKANLKFKLPKWVDTQWELFCLSEDGLTQIGYELISDNSILINDEITEVGVYVLLPSSGSGGRFLKQKWQKLIDEERNHTVNWYKR